MRRLLIAGAAGGLGRVLRGRLASQARILRLSDLGEAGRERRDPALRSGRGRGRAPAGRGRRRHPASGRHLGGKHVRPDPQRQYPAPLQLYKAARAHGHPRILFGGSNHAIGFCRQDERLDAAAPLRPDGLYGVSKCFVEAVAPRNHRMLSTWLSYDGLASLIGCVFAAPRIGCPVVWGMSDNDVAWWDNGPARYLGWHPRDNAERFCAALKQTVARPAPDSPLAIYQGGPFTQDPIHTER